MTDQTVVTPILTADLGVEAGSGGRMPVYVHLINHDGTRVLVDTGIKEQHPAMSDMDARLYPWSDKIDPDGVDLVINTHLHADHCGGNHLFASRPFYVQQQELDDALSLEDYTLRKWVEAPGVRYTTVHGETEVVPGIKILPAPGHTRGSQIVVIDSDGRRIIIAGDTAVWFGELDEPTTEGQSLIRALRPDAVWLSHEHQPWKPPA